MRRIICAAGLLLAMVYFAASCSHFNNASAENQAAPIILGYYPSWESGVPPEAVIYKQFTHICHVFVGSDKEGRIIAEGNLPSRELTARAHAAGVKVLLSLGGMDSGEYLGDIMRTPAAADRFIAEVSQMVLDYDYDGVDIDWEFPKNEEDCRNLTIMAWRFRKTLGERKPGALVTAAVPGIDWFGRWFDAEELFPLLDFINVMTYDMHGPWGSHAGFNSIIKADPADKECRNNSIEGQMDYWVKRRKCPRNKLLVGIPLYGRGFAVQKWYDPIDKNKKPAHPYVPFKDIAGLQKAGWTRVWDSGAGAPYLKKQGVLELISYDDEETAAQKGRWAAQNKFAGIFFWEISQDYIGGEHRLVRIADKAFRESKETPSPKKEAKKP
ncbi:MAG TPA: glycoside hydrolase family 18 protein [Candidatus Sumerlaeota bacterium]|nr:MAG: Chitinase A1 precursor [candidate division BRC1 bacterium ADurb.Bin183]HQH12522.1 glycoside hydrolase family 18 protein [Candidatus Sumerlaeota bacterium]